MERRAWKMHLRVPCAEAQHVLITSKAPAMFMPGSVKLAATMSLMLAV